MMDEAPNTVTLVIFSVVILGIAFGSLFLGIFGLFLALIIVVLWYIGLGHHFTTLFLDRTFKVADGAPIEFNNMYGKKALRLIKKERFEDAIEECRKWMTHERENAAPILLAATIRADHLHDRSHAIRDLEIAVSRPFSAKDHVSLALQLCEWYRLNHREIEIAKVVERVACLHAHSPEIHRLAAYASTQASEDQ